MSAQFDSSCLRRKRALAVTVALGMLATSVPLPAANHDKDDAPTKTPIKHLVVVFQENRSFDHYFGTYPRAANLPGETPFYARKETPRVNGLDRALLNPNPNSAPPTRLSPSQAITCSHSHDYTDEQKAFDEGLMDLFPEHTGDASCDADQVVDYFDGNTVTALWNYAQNFAMSDNSFNTTFGPSTVGAVNLISGQTHGINSSIGDISGDSVNGTTVVGDADPLFDNCASPDQVSLGGKNIGDLLNAKGVTWGWFSGGFKNCQQAHPQPQGGTRKDYVPHHEPFQYYQSTANPNHLRPSSSALIGHQGDQANHQYDTDDFWTAASVNNLPAVSFIKAPAYEDGNPGYSTPLLEQQFVVDFINRLQSLKEWPEIAVVLAWDDSGGWYDHVMSPIVNQSQSARDAVTGPGQCGSNADRVSGGYEGRCGYATRLPLLVVSSWAKQNYVDHAVTDQTSILRFIEDNWGTGRIGDFSYDERAGSLRGLFDFDRKYRAPKLFLDPVTGQVVDRDR